MTVRVVNVRRRGTLPPRAVQIPALLTDAAVQDLYGFGFGERMGAQRLVCIDDDSIEDYDDAVEVMRRAGCDLALYDRDCAGWIGLSPGDWVVEPQDDKGDGFIKLSPTDFAEVYEVSG